MKKILIVDDRIKRQSQHLPGEQRDVELIDNMPHVSNKVGPLFQSFISRLLEGDYSEILEHDLWIMHRSFLAEKNLLNIIQQLAEEHRKHLVLFSGSITQSSFSENGHSLLSLNSKTLYSERFIPFLGSFSAGKPGILLALIYGDRWELSSLFKYRQVLCGVEYPGRQGQVRDELEGLLGAMTLERVNEKITEILLRS